ncbi:MAG: hypothetical protein KH921_07110 [Erysipelotrichaceae bacterium]|nr:hypothetical protein [Erysipelotrichaceae bacterium]
MWLLKLHFSISILCLLTFIGFRKVFREQILKNGYIPAKKKYISGYFIFFVPLLNLGSVLVLFIMISIKKKDLDRWCEERKEKED